MMMDHDFAKAYKQWLAARLPAARHGQRALISLPPARRMESFLRDIWWPEVGSFGHLFPQVEAASANGKRGMVFDLAYLKPPYRLGISLGSPCCAISAASLSEYWIWLRFTPEQIRCRPDQCRFMLRSVLKRLYPREQLQADLTVWEKEIVRLAARAARPITPADAAEALSVSDKTARAALKALVEKRVLKAAGGGTQRIRSYVLACEPQRLLPMLG